MPRTSRAKSKTGIYHILIRGINQQRIFEQEADCERFLECLSAVKKQTGFKLFAYCLMGNHAHLLLMEGGEPIDQVVKRLGVRYVQWFNNKYRRVGHLFQDRFRSEPVENDEYFLEVLLYIYQNPVKAGICRAPVEYEWSSRRFLGGESGIVDEAALAELVSISAVIEREQELIEDDLIGEEKSGRWAVYEDNEVEAMFWRLCGVQSTADFQRLPHEEQMMAVARVRAAGIPIRQIARVIGVGKGMVEYWIKKYMM